MFVNRQRFKQTIQNGHQRNVSSSLAYEINDPKVKISYFLKNSSMINPKITIRLIEECGVVMYCDLHAHSRKHNVFIYGCENRRGLDKRLHEQVFPLMLHKNCADKVSPILLERNHSFR